MQLFLSYILTFLFIYLNIKILYSDLKYKIIPNKGLIGLVLVGVFYVLQVSFFHGSVEIIFATSKEFLVSLFIGFTLFYYGIWSAGDAKYISVLGLFIGEYGTIALLGNVGLITILYLLGYFVYFYFYKFIFEKEFRSGLVRNIQNDIKEQIIGKMKSNDGNIYKEKVTITTLNLLVTFLIVFTGMRLIKMYFIEFVEHGSTFTKYIDTILGFFKAYTIHSILISVGVSFLMIYITKYLSRIIKKCMKFIIEYILFNESSLKKKVFSDYFYEIIYLSFLALGLGGLIIYEYNKNPNNITQKIHLIFTMYLGLYFLFRILSYAIKVTFQISEQRYVEIENLLPGEILDKSLLIKLLGNQGDFINSTKKFKNFDINTYVNNLENPLSYEDTKLLKEIFRTINSLHERKKTPGFNKMVYVKSLHTFAFGGYIFCGFIITYLFGDKPLLYVSRAVIYIWEMIWKNL